MIYRDGVSILNSELPTPFPSQTAANWNLGLYLKPDYTPSPNSSPLELSLLANSWPKWFS